jgi:cellulose synthase/poly-beta-1,6-N-acetylglucosamine synthase-like glycosyltransferase
VLVCDDGNNPENLDKSVKNILQAARNHPPVAILHRPKREGFKAGNINNALRLHGRRFEFFAVADADEILPEDFLSQCVSRMSLDQTVGFAQCAHVSRTLGATEFATKHNIAVAGHWRHFVPARESYGLLPFYGHGAVVRMKAWQQVGGFPEIVSEDLGLTFLLYQQGYRGIYIPEIICKESFPSDFRVMTRRAGKWVRGTLQFLRTYGIPLVKTSHIGIVEKLDLIFCALMLLLPLPFVFMMLLVAAIYLSNQYELLNGSLAEIWKSPIVLLTSIVAMLSPMAYTLTEIRRYRFQTVKQLLFSAGTCLAIVPHSAREALGYMLSGRASFPVTGSDQQRQSQSQRHISRCDLTLFLLGCLLFAASMIVTDLLLMGVAIAFIMGVICLSTSYFPRMLWLIPFILIVIGITLTPLSLLAVPLAVSTSFATQP